MDISLSYLNTALAGVFALLLVYYCLQWRSRRSAAKITAPPEASGGWPIIGHLLVLGGPLVPHRALGAMADKYGPAFTIRLGAHRSLVVSSWEMAKELFTTNDLSVCSRPKFLGAKLMGYDYAMFGFSPYGPYWREIRKISSMELMSNRRLELLRLVRVSETQSSLKELYELWAKQKDASSGRVLVDMKQWFGDLTLNVILRMVAGKRYYGSTETVDGEAARRCQKMMADVFHLMGLFVPGDAIPSLAWLDLGGYEKAMKETAKEMDDIVEEWLQEHRRKKERGQTKGDQDFMDVMLSVVEGADLAGYDADTVVKATCLTLITAGTDTTSVTLTWALSLLMNNRRVLKKAQEELDAQVGRERQVTELDINNLVYLQAIVKELLRLYPPGPLSGPREFRNDCTIGGYHIPKGTRLTVNLWKIQRDPRVWLEPSEFRPERFLTTHKEVDLKGQHFELIPFGTGRRICPGMNFALQMVHLVLASLLQGFEFSTPSEAPIDMTESAGLSNSKPTPLEVLVSPRLSPNLYF